MSDKMNYVDVVKNALWADYNMFSLLLALSLSLFVFKNSLYFTIMLLGISILTLSYLVLKTSVGTLTAFILIIVSNYQFIRTRFKKKVHSCWKLLA